MIKRIKSISHGLLEDKRPKKICQQCGKKFKSLSCLKRKFCSQKCYWLSLKRIVPTKPFIKGHLPWNKGKTGIFSKKTLQRIKEKKALRPPPMKGKHHSIKTKEKLRKIQLGKKLSEETKKKIREFCLKHPEKLRYWKGKHFPEIMKQKISKALKGRKKSKEHIKKLSGSNHWNWQGGKSFEPYSTDWTETLKKAIRQRDKYTCQLCSKEPAIDVHHINYDKQNCNPKNLITLCHSCNSKVNKNRKYWTNYFKNKNEKI